MPSILRTYIFAVKQKADEDGEHHCGIGPHRRLRINTDPLHCMGALVISSKDAILLPAKCKAENRELVCSFLFLRV